MEKIGLEPIGIVRKNVEGRGERDWQNVASEIVVKDELRDALDNIEEFSHIIVLYWMHKVGQSQRSVRKVHPKGQQELPLVGVFASRSPARPNPIGMTIVKLVSRRNNILKVTGLDALDGTPVLDIKPYIPSHDADASVQTPHWIKSITPR
jgi:tRNA-Thr(GGU) m(6)t(6)A37 methyltransferase TsaA